MNPATEVNREQSIFIQRLDESRKATTATLVGIDPEQVIYADSGWRVKDLIAHLTAWEQQVVLSLRAYSAGSAYSIPNFVGDDAYNDQIFQQRKNLPIAQIYADWDTIRADFRTAIEAIPPERFDGDVMCPWGLTSAISGIVNDMIGHEADHLRDILNAG